MNFFVSLVLVLTPLLPADIPPTLIYLGPGVDPIHSLKLKMGGPMPYAGLVLTPANWVRLKSALEGAPDLCVWAVDEAIKRCEQGAREQADILLNRETEDKAIISAYEIRLQKSELALESAIEEAVMYKWTSTIIGTVLVGALTWIIVEKI